MPENPNAYYPISEIAPKSLDCIREIVREEMRQVPREPTPEMLAAVTSNTTKVARLAWIAMWDVAMGRKPCES